MTAHDRQQVVGGGKGDRIGLQPDARDDFADAHPIIDLRGQHQGAHAAFAIVMAGLEQDRRFSCIHRRVVKVELRHDPKADGTWGGLTQLAPS